MASAHDALGGPRAEQLRVDEAGPLPEDNSQLQSELLQVVFGAAPMGMAVVAGPRLHVKLANPSFGRLTSHAGRDPAGRPLHEVLPQNESLLYSRVQQTLESGRPFDIARYTRSSPEGRPAYFSVHGRRLLWHGDPAVLLVFTDIGVLEALAAEAQTRASELDAALASIGDLLVIYGADGKVTRLNRAANELLNAGDMGPPGSVEALVERMHPEKPDGKPYSVAAMPSSRALQGKRVQGEVMRVWLRDQPMWFSVSAAPIIGPDDRPAGAVSTLTDISALHTAQERLEAQARELATRNQELAELSRRLEEEKSLLEVRVLERTADLTTANWKLQQEIAQRRLVESELSQREERFRRSVETMLDGFAILSAVRDEQGKFLDFKYEYMNNVGLRMHRRAADEIIGHNSSSIWHSPITSEVVQQLLAVLETGRPLVQEILIPGRADHPAGRPAINLDVQAVKLGDGVAMTWRDVTERERVAAALRESRFLLQSALDALPANIAILDAHGTIIEVNASWRSFAEENGLQWSDHGLGHNYLAVLDATTGPDSGTAQTTAAGIREVLAGKRRQYSYEYACNGCTRQSWYSATVTGFGTGEHARVVVSHTEVTGQKLAEQALRSAKDIAERGRREAEERRRSAERQRQSAETLRGLLAALNSNQPLDEILQGIVGQARQLLASDAVTIYRHEGADCELAMVAAEGLPPGTVLSGTATIGQQALDQAVATGQAVVFVEESLASSLSGSSGGDRYPALLAVPILSQTGTYGAIVYYYKVTRAFPDDEVQLALTFASQVALAIENAALRDQLERAATTAERSRLARELHDAVTQTLFSASIVAEALPRIWQKDPEQGLQGVEELRLLTRGALVEMRGLLLEMRPAALEEKPLRELLRQLADAFMSRTRVPVDFAVRGDESILEAHTKIAFYRIAQEVMNNISKHARARRVAIELQSKAGSVTLRMSDDGVGFNPRRAPRGSLGLGIMRERADSAGLKLRISSRPGQGTVVLVEWYDRVVASEAG